MKTVQPGEVVVEDAADAEKAWAKASELAGVLRMLGWQRSYGVTVRRTRGSRHLCVVVARYNSVVGGRSWA